jgi:hypothetical protein
MFFFCIKLTLLGFQFWVLILRNSEKAFDVSGKHSAPVDAYSSKITFVFSQSALTPRDHIPV